jgi:small subunit ribosomal protein S9
MAADKNYTNGTGRRKTSIARVYIKKGKGNISVNDKTLEDYFPIAIHNTMVKQPLAVLDMDGALDIKVNVAGGGVSSQAEAVRHGLARALEKLDGSNRDVLKANGYLTRDPRMVERKKYGRAGARKRFQFSKR